MITNSNSVLPNYNKRQMSSKNKWLERLDEVIEKNINMVSLSNNQIATELLISERQLFRKVNKLAKQSPQKYLRKYRLKRAMKYLKEGKYRTVKETAFSIGYIKSNYFVTQFEKEFGIRPLEVLQNHGWR